MQTFHVFYEAWVSCTLQRQGCLAIVFNDILRRESKEVIGAGSVYELRCASMQRACVHEAFVQYIKAFLNNVASDVVSWVILAGCRERGVVAFRLNRQEVLALCLGVFVALMHAF